MSEVAEEQKGQHFLTSEERRKVMDAIARAEEATSGEIRVHIEAGRGTDAYDRAKEVFNRLKMFATAQRNGVLIYVAVKDHRFAIIGDEGIHNAVPKGFWEDTRDAMKAHFVKGEYCEGLCKGLAIAGEALGRYFPYQGEKDVNELSNEISEG